MERRGPIYAMATTTASISSTHPNPCMFLALTATPSSLKNSLHNSFISYLMPSITGAAGGLETSSRSRIGVVINSSPDQQHGADLFRKLRKHSFGSPFTGPRQRGGWWFIYVRERGGYFKHRNPLDTLLGQSSALSFTDGHLLKSFIFTYHSSPSRAISSVILMVKYRE